MARENLVASWVKHFDEWPGKQDGQGAAAMTKHHYPYDHMFSPIQINRLQIPNRLVMAPMGNIDMCEETGRPSDMMLHYFFERARGGTGLLTTGLIPVSHGIDATVTELGKLSYFPRIDRSRTVFSGWRDLAQGVHAFGSRIFIQLTAGLGRVGNPQCLLTQHKFPPSASMNPNFYIPQIPSLRMSDRRLKKIVKNIGQAAADAKAMGIDGVYLHGHEGYLIEQMTNPAFNRRKIGRYADWKRFGIDMVETLRKRVGPHYPIMYRIDLSLALEECYSDDVLDATYLKKFKGGRTIAQTLDYMEDLIKAGVDIFDVDLGCYDNWWLPHPPSSMPAGCFLPVSQLVKEHFAKKGIRSNAGYEVPVVAVGKLGYPDLAEEALKTGKCDMIMLGRPLLADPDWPKKAYAGEVDRIRPCIGCQEGCLNEFVEGGHPQCAVNPRTSFEYQFPLIAETSLSPKKIAVIGAGPAGVVTAIIAAKRGHQVDLYEKGDTLGGRIIAGSVAAIKFDVKNYLHYLQKELDITCDEKNLKVHWNTTVSADSLKEEHYDIIVSAVGTQNSKPPVPGIDSKHVLQAVDLFVKPDLLVDAKEVVVIGGGVVGCEMAQWLAVEKGLKVSVVEMLDYFMDGTCTANRGHLLHSFKAYDVKLYNAARLVSVEEQAVIIERNTHKNVPDPYVSWSPILPKNIPNPLAPKVLQEKRGERIKADLVVVATGGKSDEDFFYKLQAAKVAKQVYNIGDSFAPGNIHSAVRSAWRLANQL